jgi:hypothetical protein
MNRIIVYLCIVVCSSIVCSCSSDNEDGGEVLYGDKCADVFQKEDLIKYVSPGDSVVVKSLHPFMVVKFEGADNGHQSKASEWLVDRNTYPMTRDEFIPQQGHYHWLEIEHPTDCLLVLRVDKNADRTVKSILIDTDVLPNNDGWLASNERMNIFLKE